jgi:hypothetical protein
MDIMTFRMPKNQKSKSENNVQRSLILYLANNLRKNGYFINTSLNNSNSHSNKYKGYKPDLYARKNGREILVEIMDCENIRNSKNHIKLRRFGFKDGIKYYIFVPKKCMSVLKYQIKVMGLSADVFSLNDFHTFSSDPGECFIGKITENL